MTKILFVCHGNICRSPMAEFVMKDFVNKKGLSESFEIASAATSTDVLGDSVYPPVEEILREHGISCAGKTARQITRADFEYYDMIIVMDSNNIQELNLMFGSEYDGKISMMLDYTDNHGSVADPWYTRDFDATWRDITKGCAGLLEYCTAKE